MKKLFISLMFLVGFVGISNADYPWTPWYANNGYLPGNFKISGKLFMGAGGIIPDGTSKVTIESLTGVYRSTGDYRSEGNLYLYKGASANGQANMKNLIVTSTWTLTGLGTITGALTTSSSIALKNGKKMQGDSYITDWHLMADQVNNQLMLMVGSRMGNQIVIGNSDTSYDTDYKHPIYTHPYLIIQSSWSPTIKASQWAGFTRNTESLRVYVGTGSATTAPAGNIVLVPGASRESYDKFASTLTPTGFTLNPTARLTAENGSFTKGLTVSTMTASGYIKIGSKTGAALKLYAPLSVGEIWQNSTTGDLYYSTGTGVYAFKKYALSNPD